MVTPERDTSGGDKELTVLSVRRRFTRTEKRDIALARRTEAWGELESNETEKDRPSSMGEP